MCTPSPFQANMKCALQYLQPTSCTKADQAHPGHSLQWQCESAAAWPQRFLLCCRGCWLVPKHSMVLGALCQATSQSCAAHSDWADGSASSPPGVPVGGSQRDLQRVPWRDASAFYSPLGQPQALAATVTPSLQKLRIILFLSLISRNEKML